MPDFRVWLEIFLKPFSEFEFKEHDAMHLVAIQCVTFDPTSGRNLSAVLALKGGEGIIKNWSEEAFTDVGGMDSLQIDWDMGLAGVSLTSVGSIIGGLALGQLMHKDMDLPAWD